MPLALQFLLGPAEVSNDLQWGHFLKIDSLLFLWFFLHDFMVQLTLKSDKAKFMRNIFMPEMGHLGNQSQNQCF